MANTKNLADVIRRELASNPNLAAEVQTQRLVADVGSEILAARTRVGLTQKQLADRVGMHQSAIARLEDADYDGHSLKTLERIASALGKRVQVSFVDQHASKSMPKG
jgi:ribosome-binding protein aMBF1 (putative translation factor)